jgi:gamma-glutamyl hercynylcysteine S-oxide synthase
MNLAFCSTHSDPAVPVREGGRAEAAAALTDIRTRTLALLDAYAAALGPELRVPYSAQLNPPRWEAGHVGWFQDFWLARNRQRERGVDCEPDHARPEGRLPGADALYNSSLVAHATRWSLPLPDLQATRDYLAAGLAESLALLEDCPETPTGLYFHRLAQMHEAMHAEAATYMAQALDIALPSALRPAETPLPRPAELLLGEGPWMLGYAGSGFAFDNEVPAHEVAVQAFAIDAHPVRWAEFLPFVEAGAYADPGLWSAEGRTWLQATGLQAPRYLRIAGGGWEARRYGAWEAIDAAAPAVHLSWFEADAWCRWAGRRLPTEAEWEAAAHRSAGFAWGEVWEWTASRFVPFEGFCPHPYRDYSAPWFHERYVLKGASRATDPTMAHRRYRNFFTPERNDVHAGFRSCAI